MSEEIKGMILLNEEPASLTLSKWGMWFAVLVLFIIILLYYMRFFARPKCHLNTRKK